MAQSEFGKILKWTGAAAAVVSLIFHLMHHFLAGPRSLHWGEGFYELFAYFWGAVGIIVGPLLGVVAFLCIFIGLAITWFHISRHERLFFAGLLLAAVAEVFIPRFL